jgi:hypothetical protein
MGWLDLRIEIRVYRGRRAGRRLIRCAEIVQRVAEIARRRKSHRQPLDILRSVELQYRIRRVAARPSGRSSDHRSLIGIDGDDVRAEKLRAPRMTAIQQGAS